MHFPLSILASATALSSLLTTTNARVVFPNLFAKRQQTCTSDIYLSVINDPQYATDIVPFCSSFIGIQPVTVTVLTLTPKTTDFSTDTQTLGISTRTVTVAAETVTATAIETDYVAKKKLKGRAAEAAAMAMITPAPILNLIQVVTNNNKLKARQAGSSVSINSNEASSITSGISSACSCRHIPPESFYVTATVATVTKSNQVVVYIPSTTVETTTTTGTTTVTTTLNTTIHTSTTEIPPSTTETPSTTTTDTTGVPSSGTETSSPPTATPTSPPDDGCDGRNGTIITKGVCQNYQLQCGIDYPIGDAYDLTFFVDDIETCIEYCASANAGVESPCLGVSFLPDEVTGSVNCYIRESLQDPEYDPDYNVISAVLLIPDAQCSTTSTPSMPSTTAVNSTSIPSGAPTTLSNYTITPTSGPTTSDNKTITPTTAPTASTGYNTTTTSSTMIMFNTTLTSCPACEPVTFTIPGETTTIYGNTTTIIITTEVPLTPSQH